MAKQENMLDRSIEEILNPLHSRDEKREMIEYFRNLQNNQNQAIEMVATQQAQSESVPNNGSQYPTVQNEPKVPEREAESEYVIVPSMSWMECQPFKALAKLCITDWLLVVIAILLFINIIRKK
jgi:hypothetical protein